MPLIAAHRGSSAGTIPCNTPAAFEAALKRGADIIELDVARSREGTLFVFHPGQEPHHLLISRYIRDMSDDVPMAQPEYARRMHKLGLKVWVNAFGTHAAGHNDDLSITQNPDEGWGRLIDLGADMIQTDWVDLLRDYMRFDYHKKAKVW